MKLIESIVFGTFHEANSKTERLREWRARFLYYLYEIVSRNSNGISEEIERINGASRYYYYRLYIADEAFRRLQTETRKTTGQPIAEGREEIVHGQ